jgi:hypothetical protein
MQKIEGGVDKREDCRREAEAKHLEGSERLRFIEGCAQQVF